MIKVCREWPRERSIDVFNAIDENLAQIVRKYGASSKAELRDVANESERMYAIF